MMMHIFVTIEGGKVVAATYSTYFNKHILKKKRSFQEKKEDLGQTMGFSLWNLFKVSVLGAATRLRACIQVSHILV